MENSVRVSLAGDAELVLILTLETDATDVSLAAAPFGLRIEHKRWGFRNKNS